MPPQPPKPQHQSPDPPAKPVAHKHRRVPFHVLDGTHLCHAYWRITPDQLNQLQLASLEDTTRTQGDAIPEK